MWYSARLIPQFFRFLVRRLRPGAKRTFVDKRKAWREQEQQLIEKWNSAARRYHEIISQSGPSEEIMSKAAAVRAEIDALRKKVARLKSEFNSGKRY